MRLPPLASPRACASESLHRAPKPPAAPSTLPHFTTANGELHGPASPRRERALGPEHALATPIDQAIDAIRDLTARIQASFERMRLTEAAFGHESRALQSSAARIQHEQELVARAYLALFHASATHIQRAFRGFQTRRDYREALALRAVLRIQRAFRAKQARRAERRRQFRILSKKVLRGMKGIRARHDLSHNELLNRVSHNMMIERQWCMAMGVADTENDVLHALYRRKFVRQRVTTVFQNVRIMAAVIGFWQRLVPQRSSEAAEQTEDAAKLDVPEPVDLSLELDNNVPSEADAAGSAASACATKPSLFALTQQLVSPSKHARSAPKTTSGTAKREDLRRKQKLYTQRVYEENLKKKAVRAAQIEKQRELARIAEEARKLQEDEQRRLRLEQAQALREDLERRGLLTIKELQSKKEEELRKEEEAQQRVVQAKQKIAKEVLSGETQVLLTRKHRGQASVSKSKE